MFLAIFIWIGLLGHPYLCCYHDKITVHNTAPRSHIDQLSDVYYTLFYNERSVIASVIAL